MAQSQPLPAQSNMKIKPVAPQPNKLQIPIYSMESYQDFIYFGGGGGYEIKNTIIGYRMEQGAKIFTKVIHEENTGQGVTNYMTVPKDGTNFIVAAIAESVAIFEIDKKSGKLTMLQKFQADFADEYACVNHLSLSFDKTLLATGGDDKVLRLFQVSKDMKKNQQILELKHAEQSIQSVDVSRDNKLLIAGSKDGFAYICDISKKGAVIQKLSFKPSPAKKNMTMRSCMFARDGSVYTLATFPQLPTYIIRWNIQLKEKSPPSWTPAITKEVHPKPSAGMKASRAGQIAILMSDGHVHLLDAGSLNETTPKRRPHVMPVTSIVFREEDQSVVTSGLDYKYVVLPMSGGSALQTLLKALVNMAFLFLVLLYVSEWFF